MRVFKSNLFGHLTMLQLVTSRLLQNEKNWQWMGSKVCRKATSLHCKNLTTRLWNSILPCLRWTIGVKTFFLFKRVFYQWPLIFNDNICVLKWANVTTQIFALRVSVEEQQPSMAIVVCSLGSIGLVSILTLLYKANRTNVRLN